MVPGACVVHEVEQLEQIGYPVRALLGEDLRQLRVPLEHRAPEQVPEGAVREPHALGREDRR